MKSFASFLLLGAAALLPALSAKPLLQPRGETYGKDYDWHKGGKYDDTSVLVIDDSDFKKLQYYGDWEHKSKVENFFENTKSKTCDGNA